MLVMASFSLFRGRDVPKAASFSLRVNTLLGGGGLCRSVLHWSDRSWSGHPARLGNRLWQLWESSQEPR